MSVENPTMGTKKGTKKKKDDILKQLAADPTKVKFLQDLLNSKTGFRSLTEQDERNVGNVADNLRGIDNETAASASLDIIQLTKTALKGKYGDHVRKSIRERDFSSLQCILALNRRPTSQDEDLPENDVVHESKSDVPDGIRETGRKIKSSEVKYGDRQRIKSAENNEEKTEVRTEPGTSAAATVLKMMTYEVLSQQLKFFHERILEMSISLTSAKFMEPIGERAEAKLDIANFSALKPAVDWTIQGFRRNMNAIVELIPRDQPDLEAFEGNAKRVAYLKRYWIQELYHLRAINEITAEGRRLEIRRKQTILGLDAEIKDLRRKVEFAIRERIELVREEVKHAEIQRLFDEKAGLKENLQNSLGTSQTMSNRIEVMLRQCQNEDAMRRRKLELENELERVIAKYDAKLMSGQTFLDNVDLEILEKDAIIADLKKQFADTEDKFDEMTRTRKLKELLKNMEMADGFKRNRAARIIQAVWRRYKMMKYKKSKKKLKLRRKTGGAVKKDGRDKKDSSSEAGKGSSTRSGSTVPTLPPTTATKSRAPSVVVPIIKKSGKPNQETKKASQG